MLNQALTKTKFAASLLVVFSVATLPAESLADTSSSRFSLAAFGGLNIPNLSGGNGNELSRDYTSRLGEAFGVNASFDAGANFSVLAGAQFSSEGGKRNGVQAIDASSVNPQAPEGTYLYADFKNETILSYAEIPVMGRYSLPSTRSLNFFADFGPYVGFLLNAQQKTSGSSIVYQDRAETMPVTPTAQSFNASTDVTSSINRVNFGLTGGIGATKNLGPGAIVLDIRGAYGLLRVQKNSQDGSSNSGYALIALGYSIRL